MAKKYHIKRGDTVKVIAGDDRGKTGVILQILTDKDRAIVEGLNLVTKHVKPTAQAPEGGIVKKEAGIHVSNLMLVEPKTGEATRTGRRIDTSMAKPKRKRYSKKTNQFVD